MVDLNQAASQQVHYSRLLRLPQVEGITGLKKSSVYAGMKSGNFPACVRLSARTVAWREADIVQWLASRAPARGA